MPVPACPDWGCVSPLMPPPKARKRHQAPLAGIGPGAWLTAVAPSCPTHCATACWENGPYDAAKRPVLHCHTACFTRQNGLCRLFKKTRTRHRKPPILLPRDKVSAHGLRSGRLTRAESQLPSTACPIPGMGFCHCTADGLGHWPGRGVAWPHAAWGLSSCSKLIAIKLCAISEMHAKVRRESVAGYATDETLVCCPKEHTRWWQRYSGQLQGLLYRLILNSYLLIRHNDCILQAFMPAGPCAAGFAACAERKREQGAWPWNLCAWASNRTNATNGIGALRPGGNVTGHANACMLKPASLRRMCKDTR